MDIIIENEIYKIYIKYHEFILLFICNIINQLPSQQSIISVTIIKNNEGLKICIFLHYPYFTYFNIHFNLNFKIFPGFIFM